MARGHRKHEADGDSVAGAIASNSDGPAPAGRSFSEVAEAVRWLRTLLAKQSVVGRFGQSFVPKRKARLKANPIASLKA